MTVRRTKAYLVTMSKGDPIKIDEEEIQKVLEGANAGELIVVKQGVINPSYMINILADRDRIETWRREMHYGQGQGDAIKERGLTELGHIYIAGTPIAEAIEASIKGLEASMPKQLKGSNKK